MLRVPFVDQNANPTRGAIPNAISPGGRFLAAGLGLGLLGLLILASCLRPDPRGFGTHEQLGLPPCTFGVVAGIRCPACGMTTSWAYATHGQWSDAVRINTGGTLLAVAAAVTSLGAFVAALRGQWPLRQPSEAAIIASVAVASAMVLGEWMVRLWMG
jgi:hypothetical protein